VRAPPYRPFPDKPYFCYLLDEINRNKVLFIEKSRDMMLSWLCVGYFTHAAITTERREVSLTEGRQGRRADRLCLDSLRPTTAGPEAALPLGEAHEEPVSLKLEFANRSRLVGIPEGADQIRSYHPAITSRCLNGKSMNVISTSLEMPICISRSP
jgi:hypothetical protein